MNSPQVEIKLLRAPDDPVENDPTFRGEVHAFAEALRTAEVSYSRRSMAFDSAAGSGFSPAVFLIATLGHAAISAIGRAAGAWLKGRAARTIQVQIGTKKFQTGSVKELKEVLQLIDKQNMLQSAVAKTKKKP